MRKEILSFVVFQDHLDHTSSPAMVWNVWSLTNDQPASINLVSFNSSLTNMPLFSTLWKLSFSKFPKFIGVVFFQIHLNHISSLVVLPKKNGETTGTLRQKETKRKTEKREKRKMFPRWTKEKKREEGKKKRVKWEKERKGRKERNQRTCPQDVLRMLLAETIDILGEMLRIWKSCRGPVVAHYHYKSSCRS